MRAGSLTSARKIWLLARDSIALSAFRPSERRRPCAVDRRAQAARSAVAHDNVGGARRDRTDDLLLAKQALSQLSYGPSRSGRADSLDRRGDLNQILIMVGLGRLELPTSRLSGVRSNHLSYRPDAKRTFSDENASSCLKKEKRRRRNPALSLGSGPIPKTGPLSRSSRYGEREGSSMKAHP